MTTIMSLKTALALGHFPCTSSAIFGSPAPRESTLPIQSTGFPETAGSILNSNDGWSFKPRRVESFGEPEGIQAASDESKIAAEEEAPPNPQSQAPWELIARVQSSAFSAQESFLPAQSLTLHKQELEEFSVFFEENFGDLEQILKNFYGFWQIF